MANSILHDSRKKYLLLLPALILVLNYFYFQHATKKIKETILQEKFIETVNHVNMLAAAVDANESRFWLDHEQNILDSVEFIDSLPLTFAATYKPIDGEIALISTLDFETEFNPLEYEGFLETVNSKDNGKVDIGYTPEGGEYRVMHLYYHHMPMYAPPEQRYLVVAGVSIYSVVTSIPAWVSTGQLISMVITYFINTWLIVMVARLKAMYDNPERTDARGGHEECLMRKERGRPSSQSSLRGWAALRGFLTRKIGQD